MFNRKDQKSSGSSAPISSSSPTSKGSDVRNIIGVGTTIKGDIETEGSIRIDGVLKGNIQAKGKLVMGAESSVEGDIIAENADIEGKVTGNLQIKQRLELKSTAKVTGDIRTKRLVIDEGAIFEGACYMGEGSKGSGNQKRNESPRGKTAPKAN